MNISRLRFAVLLAIPLAACGKDDKLNGAGDPSGLDRPNRAVALTIETPQTISLGLEEPTAIVARVTYVDDGAPAEGRPVKFSISGNSGGASIPSSVTTGQDGRVQNQLTTGTNRTTFSVVVTTPQADGQGSDPRQEIVVDVDGTYRGKLQVKFTYAQPVAVGQISTRIHQGSLNCPGVTWPTQPAGVATQMATGVADQPIFESLTEAQVYTVTASALGLGGNQVAVGCAVAPAIIGRGTVQVTVPLNLRPVKIVGEYDFGARLDLADALPNQVATIVDEVADFFDNPAQFLAEKLEAVLMNQLNMSQSTVRGMFLTYASFSGNPAYQTTNQLTAIEDVVRVELLNRAPAWVNSGLTIGGDLTDLLESFTAGGTLEIEEATPTGAISGNWNWSKFMFQWRLNQGCDVSNACCGREIYDGDDLEPVGAEFEGTITRDTTVTDRIQYNLHINEHRLNIQYGNIIVFVIERIVLQAITGQSSFACAAESLFGCNGSGSFVCGSANNNIAGNECGCGRVGAWLANTISIGGLNQGAGASVCQLAVNGASSLGIGLLNDLAFGGVDNGHMTMTVDGIMADADKNLSTDLIEAGIAGNLVISTYPSGDFDGEMTADVARTACVSDGGCQAFETCQPKAHVLNDCAGRQVCVQRVGAKVGGQVCSNNNQCESGVCLASHKCLEICEADTDCASGLSCGDTQILVPLSSEVSVPVFACGT